MRPLEHFVTLLTALAAGGYLAGAAALLRRRAVAGLALLSAAWAANLSVIVLNWLASGHPPFGSMVHVLAILALCFLPLYLVLRARERLDWLHVYFAVASALPLVGTLFMERETLWRRAPALQSAWFTPHVTAYMVSYALAAVAFALLAVQSVRAWRGRGDSGRDYDRAAYHTLLLSYPFMTFGLLSGALWAEDAWGAYWSWDPKEVWSLITWTLYAIYFHTRGRRSLQRFAPWAHALAFAALLTTFLLVNLLPKLSSALHSYAMSP